MLPDLVKQPRIANGPPADHQSLRAGPAQDFLRVLGRVHVAVGQHGKRQLANRPGDAIVVHFAAIHLGDGPAVHREQINRMPGKDGKQLLENLRCLKTDPGLDGEFDGNRVAQRPQERINPTRFAQQTAARALAVNHRRGTTQIEVQRDNRVALKFIRGPRERRNVVADHLRDDGPPGWVFRD